MPALSWLVVLTLFVLALVAGGGWTLGCFLMSATLGALRDAAKRERQ